MIKIQHPLPGSTPTGVFGWRPAFTENGIWIPAMLHNGQDYAAPQGTLILAAHPGRVSYVGWDTLGGGWMVQVGAAFGSTLYLHMRERSPLVNPGDHVSAGEGIGYVGQTGTATGPHLHFMLRLGGMDVNPVPYINSSRGEPDMTKEQATQLEFVYAALAGPKNLGVKKMTWANPEGPREALYGLLDISIYSQQLVQTGFAKQQGQIEAMLTAIKQLAGGESSIDMEALEAAAEKGAREALANLTLKAENAA